jgi:ABC-type Co2+ transport system permease subunit
MAGLSEPGSLLYIPMPEPSSLALLGVGLAALILRRLLARI